MSKRGFRKGFKAPRKSEDGSPAGGLTKDGNCTPAAALQEEMKRLLAEEIMGLKPFVAEWHRHENSRSSPILPMLTINMGEHLQGLRPMEEMELDAKIKKLQDANVHQETLKTYIDLLHKYNEVKDVAQTVMGCIAVREGVPNRDIAQRYDAPDN